MTKARDLSNLVSQGSVFADGTIQAGEITGLAASATTDTTNASNITSGTLSNARLSAIPNNVLANSTISGVSLGSNLNALTISTGLSGTSYNGSAAVTIAIDSTVATLTGTQTLTNKTLTSPVINGATIGGHLIPSTNIAFDLGSTNFRFRDLYLSGNTIDLAGALISSNGTNIALPSGSTVGGATAVTTGDTGTVTNTMLAGSITTNKIIGLAASATTDTTNASNISSGTLSAARLPAFSGDATSSAGSSTLTLANSGVAAGTYTKLTVDSKGRVTSGAALSASDIPNLDASKLTSGTIDAARLPSYVDDVLEFANLAGFPTTGETAKIYVALDTNKTYRWSGSAYVYITSGAVDSVAGKTGVVTLVKGDVGLGNVENTALSTWTGSTNLTTLGTVGTGTWQGSIINSTYGGTGVNNGGRTLAVNTNSGTLAFTNAGTTLTIANTASVSGTNSGDQTITLTGDVTGSGTGSFAATLANSGVVAGTYTKLTVDAKGRVTSGTTLASADLPTYTGTITSSQVTTALGFTPYNSTNPSGYITQDGNARIGIENNGTLVGTRRRINFIPGTGVSYTITDDSANEEVDVTITNSGVTSVSGTGTVSGLTLTGTVTSTGSLTLGGTLSASIDNITDEHRLFNNMGDNHAARTSFDASAPSYNFGWRYVQGSTNGPGVNSAGQYYSLYVGLGNDYAATGAGSYGMQIAIPRNVTTPYLAIRYNEANALGGWQKISAGYADTAGSATSATTLQTARTINGTSFNGSANITTASWGTARTVTIGSTGKSVDGSANVSWSLAEIGALASGAKAADADLLDGYNSTVFSGPVSPVKQFFWNNLEASGTQARTYEIARLAIDFNDWNSGSGPFEVELYEGYYSRGLKKKYVIHWGYTNAYGIQLVEYSGSGDNNFQCRIGTPVQVSGDHYYLSVFVDVRYYAGVDVRVTTNRDITASNPPAIGTTFINASPTATNISDFTADSTVNFASTTAVQIGGSQLLHAGNYTSYSPSLTGSGASGTWGINITGNAGTATTLQTARTINGTSFNGSANITVAEPTFSGELSGYSQSNADTFLGGLAARYLTSSATNKPTGTDHALLTLAYSSAWAVQLAGDWRTNTWYSRNENNGTWGSWATMLSSANYTSYSPTLTGSGASGTWGINVTGNAATATSASQLGGISSNRAVLKRRARIHSTDGTSLNSSISAAEMGFTYGGSGEPTGPFIAFGGLGGDIDYSCQLVGAYSGGGNQFVIRTRNDDTAAWNSWRTIITDGNYTSYSPSLTGSGASGTWGINISGSAAQLGGLSLQGSGSTIGANQVARSDGNGYVFFNYINSNTSNSENPTISQVIVTNGSDNYYRKASLAHLRTAIGAATMGKAIAMAIVFGG